jgi:hypothetical protein
VTAHEGRQPPDLPGTGAVSPRTARLPALPGRHPRVPGRPTEPRPPRHHCCESCPCRSRRCAVRPAR